MAFLSYLASNIHQDECISKGIWFWVVMNANEEPEPLRENLAIWNIKMHAYLKAFGFWDVINASEEPKPLRANLTLAQIKRHKEEMFKRLKALNALHSSMSNTIFTRILTCETTKKVGASFMKSSKESHR